jgi:hypothetical protein
MKPIRIMLAVLTALAWFVSSNSCLFAVELAPDRDDCCEHESAIPERDAPQPCGPSDCMKCVTLESGINLSVLAPLAAPLPAWSEDVLLTQLLRVMVKDLVEEVPLPPPIFDPPSSRWCDVVQKVLPVRGPSLVS